MKTKTTPEHQAVKERLAAATTRHCLTARMCYNMRRSIRVKADMNTK